ncbi:hypothetical protein ACTQ33_00835 [Candidatus Avoscillospira sp. LCP25S3_F1]|uniref:hypothetical protein n=1 Tax=Candidatus Avoscillospira sp. LCP25S3_F1 TaxID=3438825 RepID=UPI003F931A63
MKKFFALTLACAMLTGILSGCGSTAVVHVSDAELLAEDTENTTTEVTDNTDTETTTETNDSEVDTGSAAGAVKTGLAVTGSISKSKSAADGEDGLGQADISVVAVTVNEAGVIDACAIDAIQIKVNFDATGTVTSDLTAPVQSKNELGADYGMVKASGIGKEWNEQAQALADYVEGKTLDEVKGIAVDESTKPTDADLASSVTISIGGYISLIEQAYNNAVDLGAQAGDVLTIAQEPSLGDTTSATADALGAVAVSTTISAVTTNGGVITSCVIDGIQPKVEFDQTGTVTTDLSGSVASKNTLGTDYGMSKASAIGKEWNEQAAAFAAYTVGKTADEVTGIAVSETGGAADADLAASCSISIGGFQSVVAKAAQ